MAQTAHQPLLASKIAKPPLSANTAATANAQALSVFARVRVASVALLPRAVIEAKKETHR